MGSQAQWMSNPYTSQPMLPSIEEQQSLVWPTPSPLPSQGLAHNAALALSDRASTAPSTAPSEPPSQTPFRTPQRRRIATPRRRTSQSQTPSTQASEAPISPNTNRKSVG